MEWLTFDFLFNKILNLKKIKVIEDTSLYNNNCCQILHILIYHILSLCLVKRKARREEKENLKEI